MSTSDELELISANSDDIYQEAKQLYKELSGVEGRDWELMQQEQQ